MSNTIWSVQPGHESVYLDGILKFLMIEYVNIFGKELMNNEKCLVYNDSHASWPMLITNSEPIIIRLAQPSLLYWSQTIFQLSHELCHYAIRQSKKDKSYTLSWFEEIVCEAMSLYALHWSSEHWKNCVLFQMNKGYGDDIRKYLYNEVRINGTGEFQKCTSIEKLQQYTADDNRIGHRDQRNQLYYEICKDPLLCRCFCDYQEYLNKNRYTIDFETWEKNDTNLLVPFLHSLQPCLEDEGS